MRKGEKGILVGIVAFSAIVMLVKGWNVSLETEEDPGIPFYSTSTKDVASRASVLYRKYDCRDCHSLWGVRNAMQAVPAPSLDGIGSWRDEKWLFDYFSAKNPQSIIPSRLKPQYRMPSFAEAPEDDRRILAQYFSSLKVKDWYLEEARKSEYEKLTGKEFEQ
jgi:hypothetical protein